MIFLSQVRLADHDVTRLDGEVVLPAFSWVSHPDYNSRLVSNKIPSYEHLTNPLFIYLLGHFTMILH